MPTREQLLEAIAKVKEAETSSLRQTERSNPSAATEEGLASRAAQQFVDPTRGGLGSPSADVAAANAADAAASLLVAGRARDVPGGTKEASRGIEVAELGGGEVGEQRGAVAGSTRRHPR